MSDGFEMLVDVEVSSPTRRVGMKPLTPLVVPNLAAGLPPGSLSRSPLAWPH